ncbi:DUF3293 domain-containing protein [Gammaproteobacteria bacterium LSUCC0112]|nr:DUF3293 domain-containing protein [Gammaproteobacteria bacterium LSUCC0112]
MATSIRLIDLHGAFSYSQICIKKRPDGLTNLPPGKVDAKADAAPTGATNREMRRPSTDSLEGFFMPEKTLIHPDKVRAYLATDYHIGQRSQRLAELFTASSVECGAFLTAYNPQGAIQSDAANERAHADLAALLHEQGIRALEGSGGEEDSDWPTEKSWFALGLQLEPAKDLGRHFDQDAIVWVDADAVPQLILLR